MEKRKLLYITLDLRRALWVPEATGAMVVCSYTSDLLPWMRERGAEVWCFEEQFPNDPLPRSTSELIGNAKSLKWLRSLGKDLTFLVFKPSNKIHSFIEKEGWKLVSADPAVCRQLEDKVSFFDLAQKYQLNIPRSEIVLWDEQQLPEYYRSFGSPLVVQERMGHAGSCTHILRQTEGQIRQPDLQQGTRVKLSEFISGPTYTFNGYVSPGGKLIVSRLYQQLMDVPQWNEFEMGTVGISPELNFGQEVYEPLREELLKMVPLFQEVKYSGYFGMDLIWNGKQWYVIECNPRFTASISLQCLSDVSMGMHPMLDHHAGEKEPEDHEFRFLNEEQPAFGHIVLRNSKPRPWKIPRTLKSGIYKKNQEGNWEMRIRSYDAQEMQEGEILLVLAHDAGSMIDPGSDFGGLQYKGSAYVDGKIDDRFFDFYDRVVMGYLIRPQDFWEDRYLRFKRNRNENLPNSTYPIPENLYIWNKPTNSIFSHSNLNKYRVTEAEDGEVLQILGANESFYFVKRADNTFGWIKKNHPLYDETDAQKLDFSLPNKSTKDSESFFAHWNGKPYLYGGNSEEGIDCSAFVQRYFWEVKGILLPKNSQDQKAFCKEDVPVETRFIASLRDDDLVFLRHKKTKIPHVGIYYKGKFWHAGVSKGVRSQDLDEFEEEYLFEAFKRL
ncbi:MAG: NlpC/P60 family protein [Candidatus Altimarinota bacterium]